MSSGYTANRSNSWLTVLMVYTQERANKMQNLALSAIAMVGSFG
jgi:hypothetical protein